MTFVLLNGRTKNFERLKVLEKVWKKKFKDFGKLLDLRENWKDLFWGISFESLFQEIPFKCEVEWVYMKMKITNDVMWFNGKDWSEEVYEKVTKVKGKVHKWRHVVLFVISGSLVIFIVQFDLIFFRDFFEKLYILLDILPHWNMTLFMNNHNKYLHAWGCL